MLSLPYKRLNESMQMKRFNRIYAGLLLRMNEPVCEYLAAWFTESYKE